MTRGILIAGNESLLCAAIAAEAAKRVEHFAQVLLPNRLSEQNRGSPRVAAGLGAGPLPGLGSGTGFGAAAIPLAWNPGSPISARTLVLSAEHHLEHIDDAILVCAPPSLRRPAAELLPMDIEILVNDHIKGWFFLVRELAGIFRARRSGALALVIPEFGTGRDDQADLLGIPAAAAFRAFTQGLLASAAIEPYLTLGFSSQEVGEDDAFAAYIFKLIDEANRRNSGKWHKFGKLGFFK
jgi:NAD(P)-dependent dehydrogenase (short-subunit alcohol dehydrogenase family)